METETIILIKITASEGMWLYDGVTEPCKWVRLAEGQDASAYREITDAEYQQIKAAEEEGKLARYIEDDEDDEEDV